MHERMYDETLPAKIRRAAQKLGFDAVGITLAQRSPHADFFTQWLQSGYHAEMGYLKTGQQSREDIRSRFPWAHTVISLATSYHVDPPQTDGFRISRYAAGDDYHRILEKRLKALLNFIVRAHAKHKDIRYYVDTGPLLEREFAQQAGIGWIGKNTNIISKELGSYLFLSELVTSIEMPVDEPATDHCGHCTACIEACPTDALVAPYTLDANRCIAYLNVEKRGPFTPQEQAWVGNHLVGCDICQEVCPWNDKAPPSREKRFRARKQYATLTLPQIEAMDEREFSDRFAKSAIKRTKRTGLIRNAKAILENTKEADADGP